MRIGRAQRQPAACARCLIHAYQTAAPGQHPVRMLASSATPIAVWHMAHVVRAAFSFGYKTGRQ